MQESNQLSCIADRFFIVSATREAPWSKKEANTDSTNVFFSGSDLICFLDGFQVHIFIAIYELLKAKHMGNWPSTENWVSEWILKDSF